MTVEEQAAADAAAKKTADDAKAAADVAAKKLADDAAARPPGIEGMTPEKLQALYKQSPELFKGVVPEPVKEEKKIEPEPKKSAAPTLGDVEIKLPGDVPVDRVALDSRLALAKELGLTAAQFQRQLDHEVAVAREFYAKQKPLTQAEQDAANVEILKKDFGADYDSNMATARGAFDKIKGRHPDLEAKLKTSDPAYVKLLLELGNADKDDTTPNRGDPRNGEETTNAEKAAADTLKLRYPNSPQLFT